MKLHRLFSLGALALFPIIFAGLLLAQDKPAKDAKSGKEAPKLDEAEMMKKWMAAATPGPAHKALESQAGEWELATRMWMPGVDAPTETKGTASTKWIVGRRLIQSHVTGDTMRRTLTGMSITGYDNLNK